ncbi:mechanosensitive ion channel family protein [Fibrella forsythiae]|uniref:Mechanosensitive ion channel n=1 Tax=Fibrella forsythiae TaxID=2817061 RepID=A0ABS3JIA6_9BACT|nr:mechanosensitive ion channel domain-containing protein [Fibrella forsythiae]MBO0949751.1 mechanosensitive ion channel [Fibrella forsythiae]
MQQQLDSWIRALVRWFGYVPNRDLSGWILLIISIIAGVGITFLLVQITRFILRHRYEPVLSLLRTYLRVAFYFWLPSLFFLMGTNLQSDRFIRRHPVADKSAEILFLLTSIWLALRLLKVGELLLVRSYDISSDANLSGRKFVTQVQFFRRILSTLIVLIGFSLLLLSFQGSRKVGVSVLTSAGIVSVLVGFAAQKSLGNLLAGIQIAFSQQIRLDDAVVVENEWGRIEEINLTNVVVRLWDRRRLILPITYFVETPFQNWTRSDATITGAIMLYLDYNTPIEAIREKAKALAEADPLWNQQVFVVQVTDTTPTSIAVRILVSANDAPSAFDLRCHIREAIIAFLRDEHPESLPQSRVILHESGRNVPGPTIAAQPPENNQNLNT